MAKDQTEALVSIWANMPWFFKPKHVTLQCARKNIRRAYIHKQILIFSDSHATLMVLSSPKVTSGLVVEGLDALYALASQNKVTLVWVPGRCGIPGNEKADKLARQGAAMLLCGPEVAHGAPSVQQERQLKTGFNVNIALPGKIYHVIDMTNFLLVNHVTKELKTCLN
jgi:hypothetical protein